MTSGPASSISFSAASNILTWMDVLTGAGGGGIFSLSRSGSDVTLTVGRVEAVTSVSRSIRSGMFLLSSELSPV